MKQVRGHEVKNTVSRVQMHPVKQLYQTKLKSFFPPVRFAFAYGSAVFTQFGKPKGKMLDMIFVVDNPTSWHADNMIQNWSHYSAARYLGPRAVGSIQSCVAGVYYNPMVKIGDQLLKYGVMSMKDLIDDLQTWKWLYVSGRLHKPVVYLTEDKCDDRLLTSLDSNLKSAALCGLLLIIKEQCTEEELYCSITSLSYRGDFRMYFGEDKNKVSNIVKPNQAAFKALYAPHVQEMVTFSTNGVTKRMNNGQLLKEHREVLPLSVVDGMKKGLSLQGALSNIVRKSSIQQSCKGIVTSGVVKSFQYSFDKVHKMYSSSGVNK